MNIFGIIIAGLLCWTGAGIVWLILALDRKTKPGKWYDWFFAAPVFVVAPLIAKLIASRKRK